MEYEKLRSKSEKRTDQIAKKKSEINKIIQVHVLSKKNYVEGFGKDILLEVLNHQSTTEFFYKLSKLVFEKYESDKNTPIATYKTLADLVFSIYLQCKKNCKSNKAKKYNNKISLKQIMMSANKTLDYLTGFPNIEFLRNEVAGADDLIRSLTIFTTVMNNVSIKNAEPITFFSDSRVPKNWRGQAGERNLFASEISNLLLKMLGKSNTYLVLLITEVLYSDIPRLSDEGLRKLLKS